MLEVAAGCDFEHKKKCKGCLEMYLPGPTLSCIEQGRVTKK